MNKINWNFNNTYFKLSKSFKEDVKPVPVKNPELILLNKKLASSLNLDFSNTDNTFLAKIFSGNLLPDGCNTIAQAYAGHQFGHFTMLGDGRAVMLGEHTTQDNIKYDIQFKGSGKTIFSRNGDGRAALGPMLREYMISEAMFNLNIPTTRSLAVVKTGEEIIREKKLQGAILTRVASSHIRVGTFQYIFARQNKDELKELLNYTINRHYQKIKNSKNLALDLLNQVIEKQCDLVVNWMRVGFVHGVMNTDNMTISGETIDYGPCAFMDIYDPKTVFSSIDKMGRYAYCNQPKITKWNLARLAECLLPLIDEDTDKAIEIATQLIDGFEKKYENKWMNMMKNKLGLFGSDNIDKSLILELLNWIHKKKADYTNTFCYLMKHKIKDNDIYTDTEFLNWEKKWNDRLIKNNQSKKKSILLMKNNNPSIIPRNSKVEEVLNEAEQNNFSSLKKFLEILSDPYTDKEIPDEYKYPALSDKKYQTFCGT